LLDEFLDVLKCHAEHYGSLLSVLKEEHGAIIESKLEKLNDVNSEKEALVLKIQNLEDRRLNILERLANSLDRPVQGLTLKELSQFTQEPFSSRLKTSRANLLSLMKKVREANDNNRSLLTHSADLVKGSMVLLNNLIASNGVYYRSGKIQNKDKNGRVFSGEI
jgi:flagellar biosynthesis/type III secretory pathway chaperone